MTTKTLKFICIVLTFIVVVGALVWSGLLLGESKLSSGEDEKLETEIIPVKPTVSVFGPDY